MYPEHDQLKPLINLLKHPKGNVQFSTVQTLSSILPLCRCSLEYPSTFSTVFVHSLLDEIVDNDDSKNVDTHMDAVKNLT